ncbi:MAG: hypothetical protein JXR25_01880 [Pontiellaceae bacterium]|nr:hypothetical protein [Pontiellaceae bacterium]MBN2783548.1 hypothetical protein [Pontiellaceae bacterium]
MIRFWISMLALGFCAGLAGAGEFRIFSDQQGRAIEAKIVKFDSVKGKLQVERKDGQRVWVQPELFSKDDQAYIKEWISADQVLSEKNLQVSFKKVKIDSYSDKKEEGSSNTLQKISKGEVLQYEITLRNRSKLPITNLKLESKFFIQTKQGDNEKFKGTEPATITVGIIDPGKSVTVKTGQVTVEDKYTRTAVYDYLSSRNNTTRELTGYNEEKVSEQKMLGLWLKIYGPEVDGDRVVRDVLETRGLDDDVNWKD